MKLLLVLAAVVALASCQKEEKLMFKTGVSFNESNKGVYMGSVFSKIHNDTTMFSFTSISPKGDTVYITSKIISE
jgi:uncharacterized lipoprotein YajG